MFSFFRKPQSSHPTKAIAQALASDGLPPGMDAASLTVVQQSGSYSGRHVTYFRVFDPARSAERSIRVQAFADLDAYPEFIVGSGHIEKDGAVVITRMHQNHALDTLVRGEADRAQHADDERFVFPDGASGEPRA